MKLLAILLAVSANNGLCPGYRADGQSAAAISLRACVGPQVKQLERSGESPGDIATAVMETCSAQIEASVVEISSCLEPREQLLTRRSFTGSLRDEIVSQVVQIRAGHS